MEESADEDSLSEDDDLDEAVPASSKILPIVNGHANISPEDSDFQESDSEESLLNDEGMAAFDQSLAAVVVNKAAANRKGDLFAHN